jgi:hypothetical protein
MIGIRYETLTLTQNSLERYFLSYAVGTWPDELRIPTALAFASVAPSGAVASQKGRGSPISKNYS